jgi:triosephosphate isomerase
MGRTKIIAGNWKMNKNLPEAVSLVKDILKGANNGNATIILFPPFPLIPSVTDLLKNRTGYFVGAQNCSEHSSGAYTGEVSSEMISSVGCKYVLVGHSERRQYFNEQSSALTGKIKQLLASGLKPVFCIGEKLEERKNNFHFDVVKKQLTEVLSHFSIENMSQIILAYEPVWAIGTGETATPVQAQEMHTFIRKCIAEMFGNDAASTISILYGGSCNAQNARELFSCPDIDGGLIGGASLKAEDFCKIIASV